jgi:hypothetical protein
MAQFRILSLDCGGAKGFYTIGVLEELEALLGRNRFTRALKARNASLLVSSAWITELDTLKGDARTRDSAAATQRRNTEAPEIGPK